MTENKKIKILQVSAALDQGGVERGTVEMAAFIVAQGAESWVASQGGRLVEKLKEHGSRHLQLPLAQRNPFAILYSAVKLRQLILKENISLVHARSRAPAWAAYWACCWTKVPFVTTFHGTHRIQNRLKKFYNSIMTRGVRVIAISKFIKRHVIENYEVPESRIDVARRGFSPDAFNVDHISLHQLDKLREEMGFSSTVPVISMPGRLTRWKGQTLFLMALGEIKDLSWQAILIGGAGKKLAYFEELKALAESLGIADRVRFVGGQSEIAPYYALSSLVVSASTEPEAFGRVVVEAQAMGIPVVASAHGGSLETVIDGKTGWLFINGEASDLADKLRQALDSEKVLKKMGAMALQWVTENYTVAKMCQAEWNTYLKVLLRNDSSMPVDD